MILWLYKLGQVSVSYLSFLICQMGITVHKFVVYHNKETSCARLLSTGVLERGKHSINVRFLKEFGFTFQNPGSHTVQL